MKDNSSLSYKDAGVDIEAGQNLVKEIKGIAKVHLHRKHIIFSRWLFLHV